MGHLRLQVAHIREGRKRSLSYGPDLLRLRLHLLLLPKETLDEGVENDHDEDEEDARQQPQVHHLDVGRGGQRRGALGAGEGCGRGRRRVLHGEEA